MGANAQTTVQKFVDGAVLTAAQQNTSAATGVPVFATTVTRDAAFGGANKVLAEGQTCYLEDANVVQYYDGAAWATVGPTVAAASGLTFITGTTFTSVTSVSLPASTFTSTYANYKIVVNVTSASAGSALIAFRLRASSTDNATSNYYSSLTGVTTVGVAQTIVNDAATSGALVYTRTTDEILITLDVVSPQVAARTKFNSLTLGQTPNGGLAGLSGGHIFFATTQFDAMTFSPGFGATTFTGSYKVYGYSNS